MVNSQAKESLGNGQLSKSLTSSVKALSTATQSLYKLAPAIVVLLVLLSVPIVGFTALSTGLMKTTAVMLILVVSLGIFIARNKFGEALFSVIGGLIAVLRVEWTVSLYVAFWSAWLGFSLLSLLISSVKIAARQQEIVLQSAIFLAEKEQNIAERESKIKLALEKSDTPHLKPIERADLARFFIFRKFSIELLPELIKATDTLSALSKVDIQSIASCVADVALSFNLNSASFTVNNLCDPVFLAVRNTRATPEEFFNAFKESRRLLINKSFNLDEFIQKLVELLDSGLEASEIRDEFRRTVEE